MQRKRQTAGVNKMIRNRVKEEERERETEKDMSDFRRKEGKDREINDGQVTFVFSIF